MENSSKKLKNKNIQNNDQSKTLLINQKNIILQNETLYVNHLNEKIKTDLLRENLYYLFSQYGDVLEINMRKSRKMKGQAFIVYKDINDASRAKVSLNNFLFLGTRINVDYAKTKSDIIVKIKGGQEYQKNGNYLLRKRKRLLEYENIKEEKKEKKEKSEKKENKEIMEDIDGECLNENKILFVNGLGEEVNEKMIFLVFNKFKGLKDIRFFNGRGFCFVEYDNEINAGTALLSLNNMKITDKSTMKISYVFKK